MLDPERIKRFDVVESTNDEARRLGLEGAADGIIAVAKEQRGGRGRLGRAWHSPPGGLWMSMLARLDGVEASDAPQLSICAGVAVAEALERVLAEAGAAADCIGLAWPNDVLADMKKIAGILCEATTPGGGRVPFAAIGVGINVNNPPGRLPPEIQDSSTSVSALTKKDESLEKMLEITAEMLDNRLIDFKSGSIEKVISEWKKRAVLFGRTVMLQSPGGSRRKAVPEDIDRRGRLIVRLENGKTETVQFEETTLIR